ncbi:putative zinc-binding protein [Moorella naiadis]|uniref:putative zinc-binding protein n=1 Tax=Moorella naiadis (nom. illeg.) TaxID=3093670 RepID=UPI003D9C9D4D
MKNISRAAAEAKGIVAVDGCPMQCARRTLEKAGFNVNESLVVTRDCNVPKSFILENAAAITNVADAIVTRVKKIETGQAAGNNDGGGGTETN